jgi:ERCC4-type nuclease
MAAADTLALENERSKDKTPKVITCPFSVIIDSREQKPFRFEGIPANADQGGSPLVVPTQRGTLAVGDYALFGLPSGVVIERKSKEDLYSSISQRRENFESRLRVMATDYALAAVVIESDWTDIIKNPPPFTQFNPKSLIRTVIAWQVRYRPVLWMPMPGRVAAEAYTFRLLERFWFDYQGGKTWDQQPELIGKVNEAAKTVRPGEVLS